jgi:electron transfer flavoprotein alpha subunit
MTTNIWTWMHLSPEGQNESDLGLIAEARRLVQEVGGGRVTVVAAGEDTDSLLSHLGNYDADGVIHLQSSHLAHYNGELFAQAVKDVLAKEQPGAMLFAHDANNADLAARLGATLDRPVITRAVDAHVTDHGRIRVVRPIANGYLFETVEALAPAGALVTFLPNVLPDPQFQEKKQVEIQELTPEPAPEDMVARTVEITEADPETLAIEEADIVVAAGRGAGKAEAFEMIQRLAKTMGASLGGTRPIIDDHLLPFERQIGQTGKTVTPRLIVNCGISGANEYTAGMEKSQLVIAINTDARARIFRFADLGVVGDLDQVLPLLVEQLEKIANDSK